MDYNYVEIFEVCPDSSKGAGIFGTSEIPCTGWTIIISSPVYFLYKKNTSKQPGFTLFSGIRQNQNIRVLKTWTILVVKKRNLLQNCKNNFRFFLEILPNFDLN